MVDTNGMGFGSRVLDAREAFPLSTEFRLARFFEANIGYQLVQQDLHKKHIASIIRLYTVFPCCSNTFTRKYLDLRDTNHANQISTSSTVVLH